MTTPDLTNTGHGHVRPRADGAKARCGGPAICPTCAAEAAPAAPRPGAPMNIRDRLNAVYATKRPGDAYPLPHPAFLYGFDKCDESTLTALAVLAEVRRRFVLRDGGHPGGRANCALIDDYACDIVEQEQEDDEQEEQP